MTITAELHPDTPFSLGAAAAFGFGPHTGRPYARQAGTAAGEMRLAFVTADMRPQAAVPLVQRQDGTISVAMVSPADPGAVLRQVLRVLSLARPAAGWLAAGQRDPVLGALQREHDLLRPGVFPSPYGAGA